MYTLSINSFKLNPRRKNSKRHFVARIYNSKGKLVDSIGAPNRKEAIRWGRRLMKHYQ